MAYCENCGHQYKPPKKFCRSCGESLTPTAFSIDNSEDVDEPELKQYWKQRNIQQSDAGSEEATRLYVICISILGFAHGLTLFGRGSNISFLNPQTGSFIISIAFIAALLKLLFDRRLGISMARSLISTLLIGAIVYGTLYYCFFYFSDMLYSGKPLLAFPTPIPKTQTP